MRTLFILGTRPEAIKLSPLVLQLRETRPGWSALICATGQHRNLLDQTLGFFQLQSDWDLNVMTPGQSLSSATARVMAALEPVLLEARPDLVFVQGDTLTTLCGALSAFYQRIPVVHVEAGLRTGVLTEPFPEELNRVLTARMTSLHCAATPEAVANLRREGIAEESIVLTGNTGIDALRRVVERLDAGGLPGFSLNVKNSVPAAERLIVVTAHRRETFGAAMQSICEAVKTISEMSGIRVVFPVHPNPAVRETAYSVLRGSAVYLTEPLDYPAMVDLMRRAWLIITDSGGIQEEAPWLGKPVLVLRDRTERPEAVDAGNAWLVGTTAEAIVGAVNKLLQEPHTWDRMAQPCDVYGEGHASEKILSAITRFSGGR